MRHFTSHIKIENNKFVVFNFHFKFDLKVMQLLTGSCSAAHLIAVSCIVRTSNYYYTLIIILNINFI